MVGALPNDVDDADDVLLLARSQIHIDRKSCPALVRFLCTFLSMIKKKIKRVRLLDNHMITLHNSLLARMHACALCTIYSEISL